MEKATIKVSEENTWNLIEVGQVYFITYKWTKKSSPTLDQVDIVKNYNPSDLKKLKKNFFTKPVFYTYVSQAAELRLPLVQFGFAD
ncbi:hypothetical protein [Paenibacillus montanisoli]|nr:hypothetical protein [Paenibacillus montanisoli]